MGYVAGKLANAHGGGVSVQTSGANALTAVRARQELGLMPLAEGTSSGQADTVRVALGVDVLGLLGWSGPPLAVAAAAVPNQTTESAELILPIALPCEVGGTFLQAGTRPVRSAPLLAPPAGVPTPVQLLRALAEAAGVRVASWSGRQPSLDRVALAEPAEVAGRPTNCRMITTGRQATHDDGGGLTAWASWQGQVQPLAELRVSPADAGELGLADLDEVNVETDSHCTRARIRIVTQLSPGTLTVSAGFPEARKLVPYATDAEQDVLVSDPAPVRVDK
jgi:anaerobic selenocysteine-containing dehydrogenase